MSWSKEERSIQGKRHYQRKKSVEISHKSQSKERSLCNKIIQWNTIIKEQGYTCLVCLKMSNK